MFAGHGGKLFEKLLNCFAVFEAIEKVLNWNTRAEKDGRAAHFRGSLRQNLWFSLFSLSSKPNVLVVDESPPKVTESE